MVFVAGKTVWSTPERFKVVLDHARRYTSARLFLYVCSCSSPSFSSPSFSSPANSTPATLSVIFQSCKFQSPIESRSWNNDCKLFASFAQANRLDVYRVLFKRRHSWQRLQTFSSFIHEDVYEHHVCPRNLVFRPLLCDQHVQQLRTRLQEQQIDTTDAICARYRFTDLSLSSAVNLASATSSASSRCIRQPIITRMHFIMLVISASVEHY